MPTWVEYGYGTRAKPIEDRGDRAIIFLNSKESRAQHVKDAHTYHVDEHTIARIVRGESVTEPSSYSPWFSLDSGRVT